MGCGASKKPAPNETFEEKMQRVHRQVVEEARRTAAQPPEVPASTSAGTPERKHHAQPRPLQLRMESVDDFQPLPARLRELNAANGGRRSSAPDTSFRLRAGSEAIVVRVSVPAGAQAGSKVPIEMPDGRVVQVSVPPGSTPGQVLHVQVPAMTRQNRRSSAPDASFRLRDASGDSKSRRRKSSENRLTTPSGKLDREKLRARVAYRRQSDERQRRHSVKEPRRRRSSVKGDPTNSDLLQSLTAMRRASGESAGSSDAFQGRRMSAADRVAAEAESIVADVRVSLNPLRTDSQKAVLASKYQPQAGTINPHAPPGMARGSRRR